MKTLLPVLCLVSVALAASGCKSSCEALQQDLIPKLRQAKALATFAADHTHDHHQRMQAWRKVLDRLFYARHFSEHAYGFALATATTISPYFDYKTEYPFDYWQRTDHALDPDKGGCIAHRFDRGRRLSHRCFWILPCTDVYEYSASCTRFVYPDHVATFNGAVKLASAISLEVPGERTPIGAYSDDMVSAIISGAYDGQIWRTLNSIDYAIGVAQEAEAASCKSQL